MSTAPGGVCGWLRARGAYGEPLPATPWEAGTSGVDAYWCLRTQEPFGPDDRVAHAAACRRGRGCFREAGAAAR